MNEKRKQKRAYLKTWWLTVISLVVVMLMTVQPILAASSSAEDIRQLQEGIVTWKTTTEGEKQLLSGDFLDAAGSAESDWFAFDLARMGEAENSAAYLSRLKDAVEKVYANLEDSKVKLRISDMHRVAMTAKALGADPEHFGKDADGNTINLIRDTVWNSIWGDPGDQGINGYIWALLTIDSGKYQEPEDAEWTREKIISEILSRQLADGGFGLIKTDPSDVDLTSMTLTALAPYQGDETTYTVTNIVTEKEETVTVDEVAEKAFSCLSTLQREDGTMLTYDERTSESTSWALMALASWGKDPDTEEEFIKDGHTLLDGLKAFRLADGSIIHSLDGDVEETTGNNMAGYQALYGLEAVYRLKSGACRVFDLSDAPTVSEEDIEKAGELLPALKEAVEEKTTDEVQAATQSRGIYITIGVVAVIVILIVVFLLLIKKNTKKKQQDTKDMDDEDEDDDEW